MSTWSTHVEDKSIRGKRKPMNLKSVASAAAIAAGVAVSPLMFGIEAVNAAPMPNPSPAPTTAPAPGGVHLPAEPNSGAEPHSGGGGPKGGGGGMTQTTKTP
jgi:hypothetical protein